MEQIRIAHLFPDLLNLYGDGGNVRCLQNRCAWRGIPVEVQAVNLGEKIELSQVDIVFLAGGPDKEQRLAFEQLKEMRDDLRTYIEGEGVFLAVCGGYQMLGKEWLLGNERVEGLGLVDMVTKGVEGRSKRLVGDIVLRSEVCPMPVVGYENHEGRSYLGPGLRPFGSVISSSGKGNNDTGEGDGLCYKNVIGTYLHGPLLAKNPQVADYILRKALDVRASRGMGVSELSRLDDSVEYAANAFMVKRLGVKERISQHS